MAIAVPNDRWHQSARATFEELVRARLPLVTTNHVLGETYTLLMRRAGHAVAWRFRDGLETAARLEVVTPGADIEREAWAVLRRYEDQAFSFVDGVSFALMRRRRIRRAFAFDAHFAAAGFERLPVDGPVR